MLYLCEDAVLVEDVIHLFELDDVELLEDLEREVPSILLRLG